MANLANLFNNAPFNPADVEELDFTPVPKGEYLIAITESELGLTKNGNGTLLTLKLTVQDGQYKGRTLFDNLCVQHSNNIAQRIAQTRLKQICDATGIGQLVDTNQLHDKPLMVIIDLEMDKYEMDKRNDGEKVYRNVIKGYGPCQQPAKQKPKAPPVKPYNAGSYENKSGGVAMADVNEDIPF